MNATIVSSSSTYDPISEIWQTSGFILDSLVAKYSRDSRLKWIQPNRILVLSLRTLTTAELQPAALTEFILSQNYPNPFNPTTVISYHLPAGQAGLPVSSWVSLKVYNILGQVVVTLVEGEQLTGTYRVEFDARGLSSGMYCFQLAAQPTGGKSFTSRRLMVLAK